MKYLSSIILIIIFLSSCSQYSNDYPQVRIDRITQKTLQGSIDNKYPITIHLEFFRYSNYSLGAYSVNGWYYYDKIKTKISLSGIYDGQLTLYSFNNPEQDSLVLNFEEMKGNHWDDMEFYNNIDKYNEKFTMSDDVNLWFKNDKKLPVNLNENNFDVDITNEVLLLNDSISFDLNQFGKWVWNFSIYHAFDNNVILEFEHGSRLNIMGHCGAGIEKGFMMIKFDDSGNYISHQEFLLESCLHNLLYEEIEDNETGSVYKIEDYGNDSSYTITVNKSLGTISKN